jgi:hypothetical protein
MGKISRILVVAVALAASAGATMRATDEIFAMRRAYRKVQRVPATRRGAGTGCVAPSRFESIRVFQCPGLRV